MNSSGQDYLDMLNRLTPEPRVIDHEFLPAELDELPSASKVGDRWIEAEIVALPVKAKELKDPIVLVRRRESPLISPFPNEELVTCEGYPTISLFTGAGGMDIGTEAAGFTTVVQHEWSDAACATLIMNRPTYFRHAALIQGDIRNTPSSMILREGNLRVGEPYLLTGGPPCQGFSTAGKRAPYDVRNDLVMEYLRAVRETQPRYFAFENVPGFQSFPHKVNGESYVERFLRVAYESYYELVYGLLCASNYGVPQRRVRFICMGTRRDIAEIEGAQASLPKPSHFSKRDLRIIQQLDGGLFQTDVDLLTHAPGIRYFPDRPFLKAPTPIGGSETNSGFTKTYLEFYERIEREEPDRIVREPRATFEEEMAA